MSESHSVAWELEQEHQELLGRAQSLLNIASELDELSTTHVMEQVAASAGGEPAAVFRFAQSILAYAKGLAAHFAKEDRHLPGMALKYRAADLVDSLMKDHKEILKSLDLLGERALEAGARSMDRQARAGEVADIVKELRSILAIISSHAEKEDEALIIMDHNA